MATLDEIETVGYVNTCVERGRTAFLGRDTRGPMATGAPCTVYMVEHARVAATAQDAEMNYEQDQEIAAGYGLRLPPMKVMKLVLMPNEAIPF